MKKLITFLSLSLFFMACEDKIELDVPEGEKKLVVDGILTNYDSLQSIKLSLTSDYFDTEPTPKVSNAEVYVTTNKNDTIKYVESNLNPGLYQANYNLVDSNLYYKLHIRTPDGNVYQSYEEKLLRVPKIDSLIQSDEPAKEQGDFLEEGYVGLLNTKEIKGSGDYYRWIIFLNGQQLIDPFNLIIRDDRLVDGNVI